MDGSLTLSCAIDSCRVIGNGLLSIWDGEQSLERFCALTWFPRRSLLAGPGIPTVLF